MATPDVGCTGKSKIPNRKTALWLARKLRGKTDEAVGWYFCRYCRSYHVGNRPEYAKALRRVPYRRKERDHGD